MAERAFRLIQVSLVALMLGLLPKAVQATECWTGWGYWVEPGTHAYKSSRILLVTKGPAKWVNGLPVTFYFLDEAKGGIRSDSPPITALPAALRFSQQQRLPYVTGLAAVKGKSDQLAFGMSHIAQLVEGIDKLDAFYRWACGLASAEP